MARAQGMAAAQGAFGGVPPSQDASPSDQPDPKVDTSLSSITSTPDNHNNADQTNTLPPTQTAHTDGTPPANTANATPVQQVEDTSHNPSDPNHPEPPDQDPTQQVDTTAPQVSSVAFASTGPYTLADVIQITVTTSENVTVTGTPPNPYPHR